MLKTRYASTQIIPLMTMEIRVGRPFVKELRLFPMNMQGMENTETQIRVLRTPKPPPTARERK